MSTPRDTPEADLSGLDHLDSDLVELLRRHSIVSEQIGLYELEGEYPAEKHAQLSDIEIAIHQRVGELRE